MIRQLRGNKGRLRPSFQVVEHLQIGRRHRSEDRQEGQADATLSLPP